MLINSIYECIGDGEWEIVPWPALFIDESGHIGWIIEHKTEKELQEIYKND